MERWAWPSGGGGAGGLTISDEGGFEDVLESLRARATCSCSWATLARRESSSACWAFSCARNCSQRAQRDFRFMERDSMPSRAAGQAQSPPVNCYRKKESGVEPPHSKTGPSKHFPSATG